MRDTKQLHPVLQMKILDLQELCRHNGIEIGISECYRTVAEQDALYAKGRTVAGSIVTNCKGSTYSSLHQWGIAFDFYLKMDVDGDGKTSDDAYNNATHLFEKVGKLGESIGLEHGGSWKNKDLPHFQLPDWGSTASKLKTTYGTPERFFKTWTDETIKQTTVEAKPTPAKNTCESARIVNKSFAGTYQTTANLNLRQGAGTNKGIVITMPKNSKVVCYGYYTDNNGRWYLVEYGKYIGYCSNKYLKKC